MTNEELCRQILENTGGKDNIVFATNCMTRLRIHLKNDGSVRDEGLRNIEGVMTLIHDQEKYIEVVVGPGTCKKCADILKDMGIPASAGEDQDSGHKEASGRNDTSSGKGEGRVKRLLRNFGEIFAPLIPGVIAAGLCGGLASLLAQLVPDYANIPVWDVAFNILSGINIAFMTYMTAWVGYRTADKFGGTPILGGIVGMMASLDNINKIAEVLGLYNDTNPLDAILRSGRGGVLAVVVGVWIMCRIERFVRSKLPDSLDTVFTPVLTLVCTLIPDILVIMPVTGMISTGLCDVVHAVSLSDNPWIRMAAGFLGAALFLPMVSVGMHHGLVAIYTVQLQNLGYVTLYPALAMAGAGQVGAAIALYLRARKAGNSSLKRIIGGGLPAGILGVGEPLIYSVMLPMGKPFITAGLGAGFGGAFVMLFEVASTTWGPSGLPGAFVMTAGPYGATRSMAFYMIGLLISYIASFIITWLVIKEKDVYASTQKEPDKVTSEALPDADEEKAPSQILLASPVEGQLVKMEDIKDKVFSGGAAGVCCGVDPTDGRIYAPAGGKITVLTDTHHALCMETPDGVILMLHVGIDTVKMQGDGFESHVEVGQTVAAGDLLLTADLEKIKAAGYLSTVILAVNSPGQGRKAETIAEGHVTPGDTVMYIG